MSQASSEFDDLGESGDLDSAVFGASELGGDGFSSDDLGSDDFGSAVGFEEASSDDLMSADVGMQGDGFDDAAAAAVAPTPFMYKKQGFSIYTLMLILSFISLTATAIIMFTYASTL